LQLEVVAGNYLYSLPASFFPDYKKHGVASKDAYQYDFSYEVRILAEGSVANLSLPANAEVAEQNEANTNVLIRATEVKRSVDLFYRTRDMMVPELRFAKAKGD